MEPTLSIIIPVYNVAQYLRHCLQSILEQGLDNYEVLLVNDASHDNSRGICSEWCETHPQFRLLNHEANMGLSMARNTGLQAAQGYYVTFVDSDDYLQEGTLATVLASMQQTDVAEYPVMENHLTKHPRLWKPEDKVMKYAEWMEHGGYTHSYAWNKVYRRTLWDGIEFPPGKYFEDLRTIPSVLQRANGIRGVQQGVYYYCARNGSISRQTDLAHLTDYAEAISSLALWPQNKNNTALHLRALNAQLSYHRAGGTQTFISEVHIPWHFIVQPGLHWKQRLKAIWFKYFAS